MAKVNSSGVRGSYDGRPLLRQRPPHPPSSGYYGPPYDSPPPPRRPPSRSRRGDGLYQPGQPIGYILARGTIYQKKHLSKKLAFCMKVFVPPILIVVLVILLVPVIWAIADHTLHVAQLNISSANLTGLNNNSFSISLNGQAGKTGIFPATIYFRDPLDVYWMSPPPNSQELHLGRLPLGRVNVASGHGNVIQSSTFDIVDEDAFGQFTKFLVTQPRFTWNLVCNNTHAEAFGFSPTYKNYVFRKHINFGGLNNFEDVKIVGFQLPGNDPAGGITIQTLVTLKNPSPFAVQIGNLNLGLYYKGMYLGPASALSAVNLTTGTNAIMLVGRMESQANNQTALDLLSELFTGFLNGEVTPVVARGVSATQTDGSSISWLSQGINALSIQVPLQYPTPIGPIKTIEIDLFSIIFSKQDPWTPTAFSDYLTAQIGLPFGFSIDIVSTANTIHLMNNGSVVGTVDGAISNSSLALDVLNAGTTSGTLNITLPPSPLTINESQRDGWLEFEKGLVFGDVTTARLTGQSLAVADTPAGRVVLSPLKFDVQSGLRGLQGLSTYKTLISNLDVIGGSSDAMQLEVNTTIINPSNLNLTTGDVTFNLVNRAVLGNVTMHLLNLQLGENNITTTSSFTPDVAPEGKTTLDRYVSGADTVLYIDGTPHSSSIASVGPAMEFIRLNATLPGLKKTLVAQAQLEVLTTTGVTNDQADAHVTLSNPFTSGLAINSIKSSVYSHGISLAKINTTLHYPAAGKADTVSPNIPLTLNLYPPDIFGAVRALTKDAGLDPAYMDGIANVGGYVLTPDVNMNRTNTTSTNVALTNSNFKREVYDDLVEQEQQDAELHKRGMAMPAVAEQHQLAKRNMFSEFNLTGYVAKSFANATLDLSIEAGTSIGDYNTTLNFAQFDVPLKTDNTLFYLLPVLAQPIVQRIVDQAVLALDTVTILDPQETIFGTHMQGTMTQAGPFDAEVSFPAGLNVLYQSRTLGTVAMPNLTLVGDVGVTIDVMAPFQVADVDFLEQFTKDALNNESFNWTITSPNITVVSMGVTVPNVIMSKEIVLKGFNGLKNDVQISSFDLPGNDPASGIHLTVQSLISNPSQLGMQMSTFSVNVYGNNTNLGPSAASEPFILNAEAQTNLTLVGRLVQQNSSEGLASLSNVFTNYVHNQPTGLVVQGDHAGPSNVTWLNNAIKTLSIPVTLPSSQFHVIRGISLNQLSMAFSQSQAWAPPTSSVNTTAPFYLPFAFPLDVAEVSGAFVARYQGQDAAVLNVPPRTVQTNVDTRVITLGFNSVPFSVYDGSQQVFSQFLRDATMNEAINFTLHGTANTKANTAAGQVTISAIPFSVDTAILGLQGLDAHPANVSDLDVYRGYSDYLQINLLTHLYNPSDITIDTGDVQFNVAYGNNVFGRALVNNMTVVPLNNSSPASLHYEPQGASNTAAGTTVLNNYVGNITSEAAVMGFSGSTPIGSLQQALGGIKLATKIPPLGKLLITSSWLTVPTAIDTDPTVYVKINLVNPFTAALNIKTISSAPVYNNLTVGQIQTTMNPPIHGPGHQTTVSQPIPMRMDTNPQTLVSLLLQSAQASGTDLGPWPPFLNEIMAMNSSELNTAVRATPGGNESSCPANGAFNLQGAMLQALKSLAVQIPVVTDTSIDEYNVTLNFTQNPVPVNVDNSALYLLGPAGAPLIQKIVNDAQLVFTTGNITHVTNEGFEVSLVGSLTTDAPTNAIISFPDPLEIRWQGRFIATISLPPVCTIPGRGQPDYHTSGRVVITDQDGFTDFTSYILHNQEFTWDISTNNVNVVALGITFINLSLAKSVSFQAFNGLPGVVAANVDLPGEGPNYINLVADSYIPSPSGLGIEMDTTKFQIFYEGTHIGDANANDLFLASKSTNQVRLEGRLLEQTTQTGVSHFGDLVSLFLQGNNSTVVVQGYEVNTPYQDGPVTWLSNAFKTFSFNATVAGKAYEIIYSIELVELDLTLNGDPEDVTWSIPASSQITKAMYANPFHFTLQPTHSQVSSTVVFEGVNTAQLNLPMLPADAVASLGPESQSPLVLSFQDVRLQALDRNQFMQYVRAVGISKEASFGLVGTATVQADTHIGNGIFIKDIPFNVTTTLTGVNSLGGTLGLTDISVIYSTPNYIMITLFAHIYNPSNITVHTRDVYLPIWYKDTDCGRAYLETLDLIPGNTTVTLAQFHYQPTNPNDTNAQELASRFVSPANFGASGTSNPIVTPIAAGRTPTENTYPESPYDAVLPALHAIDLEFSVTGFGKRLLLEIDLVIPALSALLDSKGTATLIMKNPLVADLFVKAIHTRVWKAGFEDNQSDSAVRATVVKYADPPVRLPGNGGVNTIDVTFVMTDGLLFSIDLLLSHLSVGCFIEAGLTGGYTAPNVPYIQYDVYTTYEVTVLDIPINITSVADLLEGMLGVLNLEQVINDLVPVLDQLPLEQVEQMAQSLAHSNDNPITQFACNTIPLLKSLPFCQ